MPSQDQATLEFRLLGPLEVRARDGPIALGGPKPRALLADLLVHLGGVVSVDRLIDDLWGADPPASARHALEVYVSQLRKAVGTTAVATRPPGYALEAEPDRVDALRFERLLAEGRDALAAGDAAGAATTLRSALALWRGPPLDDFTYEPFAQDEIARLDELRREAVEERIEADLALEIGPGLIAEIETLAAANPLRERLRGQLMLALYRAGRQADALTAYRDARRALVEELGVEPGPELRELEARMLRQDDSLRGAQRARVGPAPPKRRFVTVVFADLVESTALGDEFDPETVQRVLERYFEVASAAILRHGGTVEKFVGDAVMAVFGVPVAHEDDALRAARAATEIRDGIAALDAELRETLGVGIAVRIGVESGEAIAGDVATGTGFVTGDVVNVASRLEHLATPGTIVVGAGAHDVVAHAARLEPLGELALRGKSTPVGAWRLLEVSASADSVERRLDGPLVGRDQELAVLEDALRDATAARAVRVVTVVAAPGAGKSRLAHELVRRAGESATTLVARCPSYGDAVAFRPLRAIVEQAVGACSADAIAAALAGADDAAAVADRLAGAASAAADEIPWAFRRFLESLARKRPVVLVLDDLHWADAALLDVVEHLAERSREHPILAVCLAREELLEQRPGFLAGSERLELDALADDAAAELLERLGASRSLTPEVRARIVRTAGGNPLFLEQLLAHAGDSRPGAAMPATIQALLGARLDRLGPAERAVLECAAVAGEEFSVSVVLELVDARAATTARRHLAALVRRGFLGPAQSTHAFDEALSFRHGLIQAAAYGAAPKEERAELHERLATVLMRREDPPQSLDELVGYHLEQAHRLRTELAQRDERVHRLAQEAGDRLGSAGVRAMRRSDVAAGGDLLGRATGLLPVGAPLRRELLCELAVALGTAGQATSADAVLADALEAALVSGDRRIELRARIEIAARRVLSDRDGAADEFLRLADEAIDALDDDRGLGRTWMLAGWVHGGVHCRNALWVEAAERALEHYRRAGWPSSSCLGQIAAALYFGPTPVRDAIGRCEALLERVDDLAGEANLHAFLGGLEAMRERFEDASALVQRSRERYEELGQTTEVARISAPLAASVHALAGDDSAAEAVLRESCGNLERMGERNHLATQASELAEAIYQQGRLEEAEHWTLVAEAYAAGDDVGAQFSWRSVRGKVLARSGVPVEGEALAREAVTLAARTDASSQRAKTLLDLAEIVHGSGRVADAAALTAKALRLLERKGNVAAAQRAARSPGKGLLVERGSSRGG